MCLSLTQLTISKLAEQLVRQTFFREVGDVQKRRLYGSFEGNLSSGENLPGAGDLFRILSKEYSLPGIQKVFLFRF